MAQLAQQRKFKQLIGPADGLPLARALGKRRDEHVFQNGHVAEDARNLKGAHDALVGNLLR